MRVWTLALLLLPACTPSENPAGIPGAGQGAASARGETLSLACQACHSLGQGAAHLIGPNLYGIFGRQAATAPGYANYSAALQSSGIVWSPEQLDQWLADPAGFLPGTSMGFTGYQSAEDRSALIAYLQAVTSGNPP